MRQVTEGAAPAAQPSEVAPQHGRHHRPQPLRAQERARRDAERRTQVVVPVVVVVVDDDVVVVVDG